MEYFCEGEAISLSWKYIKETFLFYWIYNLILMYMCTVALSRRTLYLT